MNGISRKGLDLKEIFYRVEGASIRVASNSQEWLDGLDSFLCLKKQPSPAAVSLELTVLSVPGSSFDHVIPLPGREFLKKEGPSFLGPDSGYKLFVRDHKLCSDWSGYGRIQTDRSSGKTLAAVNCETPWDSFYSIILFGYNALMGLLYRSGLFSVHASCISVGGKGILFTGDSGSGKSTAAFALMRKGHPMVSDDRVLLSRKASYTALNISDVFKIREDALDRLFPTLIDVTPYHRALDERYYKISLLSGMRHLPQTPLSVLMTFEKTGKKGSEIKKIHPARVVKDLFPVTLNPYDPEQTENKFKFLMQMLKEIPCYSAEFGTDMDLFAKQVERTAASL